MEENLENYQEMIMVFYYQYLGVFYIMLMNDFQIEIGCLNLIVPTILFYILIASF